MSEHNFPGFNNNGCSLGELINATPFRFWCYKVMPLTYDDSLSYYEVLCKYMDFITKAADDIKHIEENQHCLLTFVQNMQNHMNQFIQDYNENITRIDNKNDEQDTELARLESAKVDRAGDTMTGNLVMNKCNIQLDKSDSVNIKIDPISKEISFNGECGSIKNLCSPVSNSDASNKQYVDDRIASLGTLLEYKGTKATIADLPSTGNKTGDVWYVESEKSAYAWVVDATHQTGHWEEFGPPINLEPYLKKDGSVAMTGNLDMGTNKITNVGTPTATSDVTNKTYVDQRSIPVGGSAGQVLSKVDGTDFNTQWVDQSGGGGLQPIDVTRESAYISTPENNFTTKVIADPTAPPERPINKDQIAVYSETNQTYAENDVTGTLLVADPHSAMEAVNKRTLDGYLSKANIDDNLERVTAVKGQNPGTESYHILSNSYDTASPNKIPVITNSNELGVDGIRIKEGFFTNGLYGYVGIGYTKKNNKRNPLMSLLAVNSIDNTTTPKRITNGALISANGYESAENPNPIIDLIIYKNSSEPSNYFKITHEKVEIGSIIVLTDKEIIGLADPTTDTSAVNKRYVDSNFIHVQGTPQEGSTIAFINGKWTVVDHTTWSPFS